MAYGAKPELFPKFWKSVSGHRIPLKAGNISALKALVK